MKPRRSASFRLVEIHPEAVDAIARELALDIT
jgi:hypothetical protein